MQMSIASQKFRLFRVRSLLYNAFENAT